MPTNLKESGFEKFIEDYLTQSNGYISRDYKENYDRVLCMDKELVREFLVTTQPKAWEKFLEHNTEEKLFDRLRKEIEARGTLDVLRNGLRGNGAHFDLAYFAPNSDLNPEMQTLYEANTLSVIRQLHYSTKNENSLDMVLFVNGLPIITIELKNQLTGQNVQHSIKQYKYDRDPNEPLFRFKRCLTHFAVDTDLAYMTTKLEGGRTFFLPFNLGHKQGAGNPPSAQKSYRTEYLWKHIWTKDSLVDLINRFVHLQKEEKELANGKTKIIEKLIFPRYHQLDVVRKLIDDSLKNGAGINYLIQHSAGSGKSNSIAWTAHHLAELHDSKNHKVFDSVIIITDRRVLDKQLQNTVSQFEKVRGVVKKIEEGSAQLKEALESGEKIIITTLQKFPFISDEMRNLTGKKFAVIVDEAHSSQTGESVKHLHQVLRDLESAEKEDSGMKEQSTEDWILDQMKSRGKLKNVSFFAFTATPKQKTLEVFGHKDPIDGQFKPFHVYSMKQAIEEGFILDVLSNYTSYKTFFKLMKKSENDKSLEPSAATVVMVNYANLHPHAIAEKTKIMIEHFYSKIRDQIGGKAKAMVVTRSRLHAVRYKQAIDKYIQERNYPLKAMVAFSGTVIDEGTEYTETGMNGVPKENTAEEFKKDKYRFMIVAEKFQTGFDQPLLTAMYVDKTLGGVGAVQTLSRLNRICPPLKENTFVLDFTNDPNAIQEAFEPYYTTTILSEQTDPNLLYDLQRELLEFGLFTEAQVREFVDMYKRDMSPDKLNHFLDVFADDFVNNYEEEEQEDFRKKVRNFCKKYAFIAQLLDFTDATLEELYIFLRALRKKLRSDKSGLPLDLLEDIELESYAAIFKGNQSIDLGLEGGMLNPIGEKEGGKELEEVKLLSEIVRVFNEKYGKELTEEHRVVLRNVYQNLRKNEKLMGAIQHNSKSNSRLRFDDEFQSQMVNFLNSHFELYELLDNQPDLKKFVKDRLFDSVYKEVQKK